MKPARLIAIISLLLNATLLTEVYFREWRRIDGSPQDAQVSCWARHAGANQAEVDFGRGVRRIYRAVPAASPDARSGFTGTREGEAEVWAWARQPGLGAAARAGADSFADAYNDRMRECLADPAQVAGHPRLKTPGSSAAGTGER